MTNSRNDKQQMVLGAVLAPSTAHLGGWRHPDAISNAGETFSDILAVAREAEDAKFDFVFFADELSAPEEEPEVFSRNTSVYRFEPLTLISALAVTTQKIGLAVTQTTTYNEPYHIARKFASIDQLSGGRSAWNLVTSYVADEAHNFGQSDHPTNADRYERAKEFLHVVNGLWNSWDEDAFVLDRATGQYFDPSKFRILNHKGKHFSVRGPLNIRRPIQGRPVQVQAGSSEAGRELAAKYAEVVFTAQTTLESALAFTNDVKGRAEKYGRSRSALRILSGVQPYIGVTLKEAQEKFDHLKELVDPIVGLARLSLLMGVDVTHWELDAPLPDNIPETEVYQSRRALLIETARKENLTLRQLAQNAASAYGQRVVIGTAESVADDLANWFKAGAVDGYLISAPYLPGGLCDFTQTVVPLLRERGLFRTDYEGSTLREHLKLGNPDERLV